MKTKEILAQKGTEIHKVKETMLLIDVVSMFVTHRVGSLIVTNNYDEVIGIVAHNDVLKAIHNHPDYITTVTVSEVMSRDVIVVTPEDDIDTLMTVMTENRIRHLPVIDKGAFVGIISIGDVVKAKTTIHDVQIQYLNDYIEGKYPG